VYVPACRNVSSSGGLLRFLNTVVIHTHHQGIFHSRG
jgi:hypothetical protein